MCDCLFAFLFVCCCFFFVVVVVVVFFLMIFFCLFVYFFFIFFFLSEHATMVMMGCQLLFLKEFCCQFVLGVLYPSGQVH